MAMEAPGSAPPTYELLKGVNLTSNFSCRDGSLTTDAFLENAFPEVTDGYACSVKRPGLATTYNLTTLGLASYAAQGMGTYGADALCVISDSVLSLTRFIAGSPPTTAITLGGGAVTQPAGATYRLLENVNAAGVTLLQNACLYAYAGYGSVTKLTGPPSSGTLRASLCELDNSFYVLDSLGRVWASDIGDYTTWPALNYVALDTTLGVPVALARHLNYLTAFFTGGIVMLYNAAVSPGAPAAPLSNGVFQEGCTQYGAETIQELSDITYWLGTGKSPGFAVFQMQGLSISTISTPEVERALEFYFRPADAASTLLDQAVRPAAPRATSFRAAGHEFYVLTCPSYTDAGGTPRTGVTLCYDTRMKHWAIWSQVNSSDVKAEFRVAQCMQWQTTGRTLMLDKLNGTVYALLPTVYQDAAKPIYMVAQTRNTNWGNQRMKLMPATYVHTDTLASTISVSWSDNDYATFSTPQAIDTSKFKKQLTRCGSAVQRAWRIQHTDNTPMRFYEIEVEVHPGAL